MCEPRIQETGVTCACGQPACWGVMLHGKPACTDCFEAEAAVYEAEMLAQAEIVEEAKELFGDVEVYECEFPDGEFPDARMYTDPSWGTY